MNAPPIFIVGAPRSGTTLLTAFLNAHPLLDAGPETQFFNKLALVGRSKLDKALITPNWPTLATKLLGELTLSGQSVVDLFDLSEREIFEYLSKKTQTKNSMLESLTELHALKNNKSRWIEKTPNHILFVEEIRQLYPTAPIIRITRDPRDSASSIKQLPWASKSSIINALLVNYFYTNSLEFFEKDEMSLTIQYEELVAKPEAVLQNVCSFIDEEFQAEMLNRTASGQAIGSINEPWKKEVSKTLNPKRCYIWKRSGDEKIAFCITSICHKIIRKFNYDLLVTQETPIFLVNYSKGAFSNFDSFAKIMVNKGFYIEIDNANCSNYLICFEGKLIRDFKTLFRGIMTRIRTNKTVYFIGVESQLGMFFCGLLFVNMK